MNIERDKFLTEQMNECWHEDYFDADENTWIWADENNNFSSWEGFGKLWEWSIRQEGFPNLCVECGLRTGHLSVLETPDRFADAVYKYLKERGE